MTSHEPTPAAPAHAPNSAREDCFIVENTGRAAVLRLLQAWGGSGAVTVESHRVLGLSLVSFACAATTSTVTEEARRELGRLAEAAPAAARAGGMPKGIDAVLAALRASFAAEPGGWVPTMGKNRYVEGVRPNQTIDVGSVGALDPAQTIDVGSVGALDPAQTIDVGSVGALDPAQTIDVGHVAALGLTRVGPRAPRRHRGRGWPDVTVGILDTALTRHPYFEAQLDPRGHAQNSTPNRPIDAWHGTFVAGIIHQVAPHAGLFGQPAGLGEDYLESWAVACAMADLATLGLPILNISLACRTADNQAPLVFSAAKAALGRQTLVVAAAGNYAARDGSHVSEPVWPAALDGVVAVGSVRPSGPDGGMEVSPYSPRLPWVDVYAPGDHVTSAFRVGPEGSLYATGSGTSFAAAAVSGAIAASLRDESPWDALDRLVAYSPSRDLPIVLP